MCSAQTKLNQPQHNEMEVSLNFAVTAAVCKLDSTKSSNGSIFRKENLPTCLTRLGAADNTNNDHPLKNDVGIRQWTLAASVQAAKAFN